jgi:hypothetical protein
LSHNAVIKDSPLVKSPGEYAGDAEFGRESVPASKKLVDRPLPLDARNKIYSHDAARFAAASWATEML